MSFSSPRNTETPDATIVAGYRTYRLDDRVEVDYAECVRVLEPVAACSIAGSVVTVASWIGRTDLTDRTVLLPDKSVLGRVTAFDAATGAATVDGTIPANVAEVTVQALTPSGGLRYRPAVNGRRWCVLISTADAQAMGVLGSVMYGIANEMYSAISGAMSAYGLTAPQAIGMLLHQGVNVDDFMANGCERLEQSRIAGLAPGVVASGDFPV